MNYNWYLSEQLMRERQRDIQRSLKRATLLEEAKRQQQNRSFIHRFRGWLSFRRPGRRTLVYRPQPANN